MSPDFAKVRRIHEKMKSIKTQMADHRLERILEVREILSAEKFKKFREFKQQHEGSCTGGLKGSHGSSWKHGKDLMKKE